MADPQDQTPAAKKASPATRKLGSAIAIGLALGIACGLFFGEYCQPLQQVGNAYVGLLQMTVLPYLVLSLIGKLGRLDVQQARRLGLTALSVLFCFWLVAVGLILVVSMIFPEVEGAAFFSPKFERDPAESGDVLVTFVPSNVFLSLTREYVPAVVVFCLFFGSALMLVPGKERLLELLDLACAGISQINLYLVRLAPFGLFALSAAAAGTLRIEEISRLQAYLLAFSIACAAAAFGAVPLLVSSLTDVRYRDLMRAASEPMLTAIATGKLFVVLPQIVEKCDELLAEEAAESADGESSTVETTASLLVPLAYPFPHLGKILAFIFISFAAWYSGVPLSPNETVSMASTGAVSSFASPLVSIPYLLDRYELPQDLMAMFIIPGFITTRMADVVGVMHLMGLTLIVAQLVQHRLVIHWTRLAIASAILTVCLISAGTAARIYLASTTIVYDLDRQLLSLKIQSPMADTTVLDASPELSASPSGRENADVVSTLQRVKRDKTIRVGYHPDHLPYTYFNLEDELVGIDVELMHRLASRLDARLVFIPYEYGTAIDQLNAGQFDVAIGGVMLKPERLLEAGFTQPYLDATLAIVCPDHHRTDFRRWDEIGVAKGLRLGAVHEDVAVAARRVSPESKIVVVNSIRRFFDGELTDLDGLIIPAEEGAAWNALFPNHAVVVPKPIVRRPIGFVVRSNDSDWRNFLDRWIDFEKKDGSLEQLRNYWIEGGGTQRKAPRWSIARNLLHWLP